MSKEFQIDVQPEKAVEEFQIWQPEKVEAAFVLSLPEKENLNFRFRKAFWDLIRSDEILRQELEQMIDEKTRTRLEPELKAVQLKHYEDAAALGRQDGFEKGRAEGYQKGIDESRSQVELEKNNARAEAQALQAQTYELQQLCTIIVQEKEKLLKAHESIWLNALSYLLKQFLVPRDEAILTLVKGWLDDNLEGFSTKNKIRFRVSPSTFVILESKEIHSNWQLVSDTTLKSGEFCCECDNGGVFFSEEQSLRKLERIVSALQQESHEPSAA